MTSTPTTSQLATSKLDLSWFTESVSWNQIVVGQLFVHNNSLNIWEKVDNRKSRCVQGPQCGCFGYTPDYAFGLKVRPVLDPSKFTFETLFKDIPMGTLYVHSTKHYIYKKRGNSGEVKNPTVWSHDNEYIGVLYATSANSQCFIQPDSNMVQIDTEDLVKGEWYRTLPLMTAPKHGVDHTKAMLKQGWVTKRCAELAAIRKAAKSQEWEYVSCNFELLPAGTKCWADVLGTPNYGCRIKLDNKTAYYQEAKLVSPNLTFLKSGTCLVKSRRICRNNIWVREYDSITPEELKELQKPVPEKSVTTAVTQAITAPIKENKMEMAFRDVPVGRKFKIEESGTLSWQKTSEKDASQKRFKGLGHGEKAFSPDEIVVLQPFLRQKYSKGITLGIQFASIVGAICLWLFAHIDYDLPLWQRFTDLLWPIGEVVVGIIMFIFALYISFDGGDIIHDKLESD